MYASAFAIMCYDCLLQTIKKKVKLEMVWLFEMSVIIAGIFATVRRLCDIFWSCVEVGGNVLWIIGHKRWDLRQLYLPKSNESTQCDFHGYNNKSRSSAIVCWNVELFAAPHVSSNIRGSCFSPPSLVLCYCSVWLDVDRLIANLFHMERDGLMVRVVLFESVTLIYLYCAISYRWRRFARTVPCTELPSGHRS